MKVFQSLPLLCLLAIALLLSSCKKSDDDSFNEPAYSGWAVGDMDQGYGTILHTANDGLAWDRQGSMSFMYGVNFSDVSVKNLKEVWVVGDTIDGYGSVWYTGNSGKDWERLGDTLVFKQSALRAVWAKGGNRVWMAGENGLLACTDNVGSAWNVVLLDTLSRVCFTAISGDSTTSVWAAGNNRDTTGTETEPVILHSSDGGTTFALQTLPSGFSGHIYDISAVNDTTAWIAAGATVFVTHNAGASWEPSYETNYGKIYSVCAAKTGTVWAGGEGGTVYLRQGGSWGAMNPNGNRYNLVGITLADTNRVWVAGAKADLSPRGTLLYTHTVGRSWFIEPNPSVNAMRRISFANGKK